MIYKLAENIATLGFDNYFAVAELRRYHNEYTTQTIVHEGKNISIQDIHGNHFYIRENGVSDVEIDAGDIIKETPYRLVAVWNCVCNKDNLLTHLMEKMKCAGLEFEGYHSDSSEIYKEETGYDSNVPYDYTIIALDFRLKYMINCKEELCC